MQGGHLHLPPKTSANTPDVVVVNEESRNVFVLEVVRTFASNLKRTFMIKVIKCQPLLSISDELKLEMTCFKIWQPQTHSQVGLKRTSTS